MSTTSMAIFSNPLFACYSVYARNASIRLPLRSNHSHLHHTDSQCTHAVQIIIHNNNNNN